MNNQLDIKQIIQALKSVLPESKKNIGLHEPLFQGNEWAYVKECIDTGWVSSVGKFVDKFEEMICEYTGVKKAIATSNGTSALHMCLQLVGVQQEDEVLVPALTFIATANAVIYCDAVPHFIDCEELTLGVSATKLNYYLEEISEVRGDSCYNKLTGRRIKAVVPMHTFGHPVDLDALLETCERFKIELVEDAAESLGSYYKGRHTGNSGKVAAVSFNGNKVVTTGGGGAILTNDIEIGKRAKHLTTQAKVPHRWEFNHDSVGYNYRLPNINAALGCAQLEQLPVFISKKRELAARYQKAFAEVQGLKFVNEPDFASSNYWLNAIMLDESNAFMRDQFLKETNDIGIMTRPVWNLMYHMPMYENCPRMECNTAESIAARLINIPSSVFL